MAMEIMINGKFRSNDDLYEEALDMMLDALSELSDNEALELSNLYREQDYSNPLYVNEENTINEVLGGMSPYDILQIDYDSYANYFSEDRYGDIEFTDDVWANADPEDVARAVLDGDIKYSDLPSSIQDVYDEYEEAKDKLDDIQEERKQAAKVISDYVNCKADVTDLLQMLDKLVRNDEIWE